MSPIKGITSGIKYICCLGSPEKTQSSGNGVEFTLKLLWPFSVYCPTYTMLQCPHKMITIATTTKIQLSYILVYLEETQRLKENSSIISLNHCLFKYDALI